MTRRAAAPAAFALAAVALAGCAGGARPDVVTAAPDRISYSWDRQASSLGEVTGLAREHCARYGRIASLRSNAAASQSGTFFTTVYDCVASSG